MNNIIPGSIVEFESEAPFAKPHEKMDTFYDLFEKTQFEGQDKIYIHNIRLPNWRTIARTHASIMRSMGIKVDGAVWQPEDKEIWFFYNQTPVYKRAKNGSGWLMDTIAWFPYPQPDEPPEQCIVEFPKET